MYNKVIVIGAGGHAKVVADIILKSNDQVIGFLDDNIEIGTVVNKEYDIKVIGKIEDCSHLEKLHSAQFVIAIGNNEIRNAIASKYKINYYTAIHPSAIVGSDVTIGIGTVIMANACINSSTQIGQHCIINTGAIIEHDNIICNYSHISPNVALGGAVKVGQDVHIGIGATVKNNVEICDNVLIGAGAVVVKDICDVGTYIGIPAKRLEP